MRIARLIRHRHYAKRRMGMSSEQHRAITPEMRTFYASNVLHIPLQSHASFCVKAERRIDVRNSTGGQPGLSGARREGAVEVVVVVSGRCGGGRVQGALVVVVRGRCGGGRVQG